MEYDVIIVGASTAGLYAARQLASKGLEVAVFEKEVETTPSRRTLIVTPSLHNLLDGDFPRKDADHKVAKIIIASENVERTVRLEMPDSIIDRASVTKHLIARAGAAGATIFHGYRFSRISGSDNPIRIEFWTEKHTISAIARRAIIGADGVSTGVGRALGIRVPDSVPILQFEVELPSNWDPMATKVWFRPKQTCYFYWLMPHSINRGVVGVISQRGFNPRNILKTFVDQLGVSAGNSQSGQVAMYHPSLRPWGNLGNLPVYLIGDAAGQVKVTTVGGTVTGLRGAQAAVEAILGEVSYSRALRSLRRELTLHWWMRRVLNRLDGQGYDTLIGAVSKPVQVFLGRHDRDSMAGAFWKLPILQPRLLSLALRAIPRHQAGKQQN